MTGEAPARRRRTPAQDRSRDTFEAICAAAALLLGEQGITALNTNAVARRAGVSITAVYAYFPDKWAIIVELSARFERLRGDYLEAAFAGMHAGDWRNDLRIAWRALARFRIEVPGGLALRQALNATPELAALDRAQSERIANDFAHVILARRPDVGWDQAYRVSWAIAVAGGALLDDTCWSGELDEAKLAMGTDLAIGFLAPYMDEPATPYENAAPDENRR